MIARLGSAAALALTLYASAALAQAAPAPAPLAPQTEPDSAALAAAEEAALPALQHFRPRDQTGINVFEAPKDDPVAWEGFKLRWGVAFTQQYQSLDHANRADSVPTSPTSPVNANRLIDMGPGFNNAVANLYLDAQVAKGIRVALTTYLSARHHNETWVKDGYLLVDASPIDNPTLNAIMDVVTLKLGHFEINYGDNHFRRTDNGNALYNPFVGNLIMDAFTTEVGAEVYARKNGFLGMVGVTGGEIRGNVLQPKDRAPSYIAKVGFDRALSGDLRVRLTGSTYRTSSSISNTLYGGDRAGSRYYYVLENSAAKEASQFTSGLLNPGFKDAVTAYVVNPFVQYRGLELYGTWEQARGRAANETEKRQFNQYAVEGVFRFLPRDRMFVGARYNTVNGELQGMANEVSIDRTQLSAGWFITPKIMLKGEYVTQKYNDFPANDIRNGGKFDGFMVEGTIAF